MTTLDNISEEILSSEVFPRMPLQELINLSKTSNKFYNLITDHLNHRDYNPDFEEMGPEKMFNLGKQNSIIRRHVIKNYIHKLQSRQKILEFYLRRPEFLSERVKKHLSMNPNVTIKELQEHPELFSVDDIVHNPNLSVGEFGSIIGPSQANIIRYANIIARNRNFPVAIFINSAFMNFPEVVTAISKNENLAYIDILQHPNIAWPYYLLNQHPNLTKEETIYLNEKYFDGYERNDIIKFWEETFSKNPNLNIDDTDIPRDDIVSHPNMTEEYIKSHRDLFSSEKNFLNNPNFTAQEGVENLNVEFDIEFAQRNPNLTIKYIEEHPELNWYYSNVSTAEFNRDPNYRKVVYRYIYRLLPKEVTIKIDENIVTGNKEFIYGIMATAYALNFKYDIRLKLFDDEYISLNSEDYRMFTIGDVNQPYLLDIDGKRFHFTYLDFLSGVKKIYESNEKPFDIAYYYDKSDNYSEIQIYT